MVKAPKRSRKAANDAPSSDDGVENEGFLPLEDDGEAQPPPSTSGRRRGGAQQQQQEEQQEQQEQQGRVMYIGNLPHGFYEKQLLGFFSQFGKLTRVRLSRNKKTGKAKHYAFLEFQYPEVARIAADAMNGYFLFKQRLTCAVVPPAKVHPQLFAGANKKFRDVPWRKLERRRHDKERTPDEHAKRVARLIKRDKQRQDKIRAAGLDYQYDGLEGRLPLQPKKILISS